MSGDRMKSVIKGVAALILVASYGVAHASELPGSLQDASEGMSLLIVGPVDALNPNEGTAIILGQKIRLNADERLSVGETAAVFGKIGPAGNLTSSFVKSAGEYVAG